MDETHEPQANGDDGREDPSGGGEPRTGGPPVAPGLPEWGEPRWGSPGSTEPPREWERPAQSWNPPPPASPPNWAGDPRQGGYGWGGPGSRPAPGEQPGGGWNPQAGGWSSGPGGPPGGWNPPPPGWAGGSAGWSGGWGGAPGQSGAHGGWTSPWGQGRPARPHQTLPGTVIALLLVVAVLVGLGIGHGVWKAAQNTTGPSGNAFAPGGSGGGGGGRGAGNPATIAQKVNPALVDINTSLSYQHGQAAGTGIVLTSDGVVLTNNHVITGATSISVTDVGNGSTYQADVVGYDRSHDIAVIKLRDASGLQTVRIGNSDKLTVGDYVVGLGNAGGVGGTPSSAEGTVVGLNRSITASDEANGTTEQLTGLIETDADIQPGDSGGALVNSSGQVIGIDTAASAGFSFQTQGGQGFAIPINQAMSIAGQIRSGQASATVHIGPTAFLGVLVDTTGSTQGATLSGVVARGPAAQAGLQGGDTIVSLGGKPVDSPNSLTALVGQYHPGQTVPVEWIDSAGQRHQATITLTTGPAA